MNVVGGLYHEQCVRPHWNDYYGSGLRAAAFLGSTGSDVTLYTCAPLDEIPLLTQIAAAHDVRLEVMPSRDLVRFAYFHPLGIPVIYPRPDGIERAAIAQTFDAGVVFGMIDADTRVVAETVVFDPQSPWTPRGFRAAGSSAKRLAICVNVSEAVRLTGRADIDGAAVQLLHDENAEVVVVKQGFRGALVATAERRQRIPAYVSRRAFSIGSGDIFTAAFAHRWIVDGSDPVAAADFASRTVAQYVETRTPTPLDIEAAPRVPLEFRAGKVYLAGPFFSISERWIVEEVRDALAGAGLDVQSPLHVIGPGSGTAVAKADLQLLDSCDSVLALLDGRDPGTILEVGYAIKAGIPVVGLATSTRDRQDVDGDLKMLIGSDIPIYEDLGDALAAIVTVHV